MKGSNSDRGSWMVDLSLVGLIATGIGGLWFCVNEADSGNEIAAAIALVASAIAFGFVVSSAFRR